MLLSMFYMTHKSAVLPSGLSLTIRAYTTVKQCERWHKYRLAFPCHLTLTYSILSGFSIFFPLCNASVFFYNSGVLAAVQLHSCEIIIEFVLNVNL